MYLRELLIENSLDETSILYQSISSFVKNFGRISENDFEKFKTDMVLKRETLQNPLSLNFHL